MQFLYLLERIRAPWLDTVMSLITHLGSETLFMVIAITVFWCVNKRHGYYLLSVGFVGTLFNQALISAPIQNRYTNHFFLVIIGLYFDIYFVLS